MPNKCDRDLNDYEGSAYSDQNSDVARVYPGIDGAKYHWKHHGCREDRVYIRDAEARCYLNAYGDLQNAFGANNLLAAKKHYRDYGWAENRTYSCDAENKAKADAAKAAADKAAADAKAASDAAAIAKAAADAKAVADSRAVSTTPPIPSAIATDPLPVTVGLYARYQATNYGKDYWLDSGGEGNHITLNSSTVRGKPQKTNPTSLNGVTKSNFSIIKGTTNDGIKLGNDQLREYTLFHVTRYSGNNKGRIIDCEAPSNWLSGFHGGTTGVAHHNDWVTDGSVDQHGSNWVLSTDYKYNYRSNGASRTFYKDKGVSYLPPITINYGTAIQNGQWSDWEVAEIIIYYRTLSREEILKVERYLGNFYGMPGYELLTTTKPTFNGFNFYGTCPNITVPNFQTSNNGLSFSAWFKAAPNTGNWSRIFDFGKSAGNYNILAAIVSGNLELGIYSCNSNEYCVLANVVSKLNDNNLRLLTWTISMDGTIWSVYIDGILKVTITKDNYKTFNSGDSIPPYYPDSIIRTSNYVGKSNWSADPCFIGEIQNVSMYNYELTPYQVGVIFNPTNATKTASAASTVPMNTTAGSAGPSTTAAGSIGSEASPTGVTAAIKPYTIDMVQNQLSEMYNSLLGTGVKVLDHQSEMYDIVKMEKSRLEEKKQSIDGALDGQRRSIQLNESYRERYAQYVKMILIFIGTLVAFIVLMFLARTFTLIPSIFFEVISVPIILLGLYMMYLVYVDIQSRDKLYFDKLDLAGPKIITPDEIARSQEAAAKKGNLLGTINIGGCVGPACCDSTTIWDAGNSVCTEAIMLEGFSSNMKVNRTVSTNYGFNSPNEFGGYSQW